MPSEGDLRNLAPTHDRDSRADDTADMDSFRMARRQNDFVFAN
jgi:hypothetical protein